MSSNLMLEVAVIGATGALGSELVAVLGERNFPVGRLRPIASESSLGRASSCAARRSRSRSS